MMTTVNGHVEHMDVPPIHIGKRKRSESLEKLNGDGVEGITNPLHQLLKDVIQQLRSTDPLPSVLQCHLSNSQSSHQRAKRQRTEETKAESNTVEDRVNEALYTTYDEFEQDIKEASQTVIKSVLPSQVEINHQSEQTTSTLRSQISRMNRIVSDFRSKSTSLDIDVPRMNGTTKVSNSNSTSNSSSEIISVRSHVEGGGVKQLFTGLRSGVSQDTIDAKQLPNGFEVVEASTLDLTRKSSPKDSRTIGEVFRQTRNARSLEMPRSTRGVRGNIVEFVQPYENLPVSNKNDYRNADLKAGYWIHYPFEDTGTNKPTVQSSTDEKEKQVQALFNSSYSSFAPNADNSGASGTESDRQRQYWKKYGKQKLYGNSKLDFSLDDADSPFDDTIQDDFSDILKNFVPDDEDKTNQDGIIDNVDDGEKLLEEVSDLLQTLKSYQMLRDTDRNRVAGSTIKPLSMEYDTYEILRSQLKILIESLPPFAVAKLDGEQLGALNVSTSIPVTLPEFVGTGQPDEYALRRNRAAQAATAAAGRQPNASQVRGPAYPMSNVPNVSYNSQARNMNATTASTPVAAPYGPRPTPSLYNNPPRPTATPNTPYGQGMYRPNNYPGATIQQYQRSLQNGLVAGQTPYTQRGVPNTYQPQQTPVATPGRNDSPQKPMVNGQGYPQGQHMSQMPSYTPAQVHATAPQRETMERMKSYQESQRNASNTPQPVISPLSEVNGITTATVTTQAQQVQPNGTKS